MFNKTVNSIVADIAKKVAQLRLVSEQKATEANDHYADAAKLHVAGTEAEFESLRAVRIADKFESLIV